MLEVELLPQGDHSSYTSHADTVVNPEDVFLDAEQELTQGHQAAEQQEVTSPTTSTATVQPHAPTAGILLVPNLVRATPIRHLSKLNNMEALPTQRVALLPHFTYELAAFQYEAAQILQRQHRSWRMAKGDFPVDNAFDPIGGFLQPASRFTH